MMTNIDGLQGLLNWKLLSGGHKFPGKDGGTCINEAAIVVAGMKYRRISESKDLPGCFSRPIAVYALRINDYIQDDDLRQELLLPFVVRLAGSADIGSVEGRRADLIALRTVTDILPIALRAYSLEGFATICEHVRNKAVAIEAVSLIRKTVTSPLEPFCFYPISDAIVRAWVMLHDTPLASVMSAAMVAEGATKFHMTGVNIDDVRTIWTRAAGILDAALKIGKAAAPIERAVIERRVREALADARVREAIAGG